MTRGHTAVQQAEKAKHASKFRDRLAAVALNYPYYRSLNPEHTKPGWYDIADKLPGGKSEVGFGS